MLCEYLQLLLGLGQETTNYGYPLQAVLDRVNELKMNGQGSIPEFLLDEEGLVRGIVDARLNITKSLSERLQHSILV